MIFVTGATGNVGAELVGALTTAGEPVRALVRDKHRELPEGVERFVGDLNDPETLAPALEGARCMFLLAGYRNLPGLLERAREAGMERVVLLSGGAAVASDLDNPISRYMLDSEDAVRGSGLSWTVLRPCAFMSNAIRWLPQLQTGDVITAPFADVAVAAIDPHDIARVAAAALASEEHGGKAYRLSGPESLLPAEQVDVLGEVLDRPLRLRAQSDDEARAEMTARMPAAYVEAFFQFSVDGTLDEAQVLPTVEEVTGARPRTFRAWAQAHADAFRAPLG
jgi:uncharacterized protein YbjT (DUF2867 family)